MAAKIFTREPVYYSKFKCIGDKCPNDCCHYWRIDWEKEAVERLKAAECSEELKNIIDSAFIENPSNENMFIIKVNKDDGACPFLEKGLCRIQKELGAEYFSNTCNVYPRHALITTGAAIRYCNISCCSVLDFLCSDENSMEIVTRPYKGDMFNGMDFTKKSKEISKYPALEYFAELNDFFLTILSDKTHSIETSVVLGAVAAKLIDKHIANGKVKQIPELLKSLAPQMKDPVQIQKLESVKPNYNIKLGFGKRFMKIINEVKSVTTDETDDQKVQVIIWDYIANLLDADSKEIDPEKYVIGEKKFLQTFEGRDFALRNIVINLFLEGDMPFKNWDFSIYENYCCFAAQIAAVKLIASASAYQARTLAEAEAVFKMTLAKVARTMCHNSDYLEKVIKLMNEYKCTSPAHLAYILK